MRSAARAAVRALDADNAHISLQRLLAAIVHMLQLIAGGNRRYNRHIFPDDFVGHALYAQRVLHGKHAVEVHRHEFGADVKAYVVITEV